MLGVLFTVIKSPLEICFFKCQLCLIPHLFLLNISTFFFSLVPLLPAALYPSEPLHTTRDLHHKRPLATLPANSKCKANANAEKLSYLHFH